MMPTVMAECIGGRDGDPELDRMVYTKVH